MELVMDQQGIFIAGTGQPFICRVNESARVPAHVSEQDIAERRIRFHDRSAG
ncbi:MAG: hypothetical protein LBQ32_00790 [Burkholderiaceae bacterium]|jgi:hypothetical protein|nr:hypothetical protein [Burkholderiaceae bacterium]